MKTNHLPLLILRLLMASLAGLPLITSAAEPPASPPSTLTGIMEVDRLLADGKADEAEKRLREMIRDSGVEPGHPAAAALRLKLAGLYCQHKQHAEAFAEADAVVEPFEKAMGSENPFALGARWLAAQEAMAAGKPADAARHSASLLETLKGYVGSGRAAAAQWENVPGFQTQLAQLPAFNESGIAAVSSLLGRAWAAAGDLDKAAPVLAETSVALEKLYGPGHPELVAVRQTLETISARRGEIVGRRYVGDLGSTGKLVFEGNLTFTAEELRRALATHLEFVLASHPSAEFADLMPVIENALVRGYLNGGFPKADVRVTWDQGRDGGCLVVRITEGPRYRMGEILISGADKPLQDQLRDKLVTIPAKNHPLSLASVVRKVMKSYDKILPRPEVKAASAIVDELNRQYPSAHIGIGAAGGAGDPQACQMLPNLFETSLATNAKADWIAGDPVKLTRTQESPMLETVRMRLAELGRPMALVETGFVYQANGTVDLAITIRDQGPLAVIGNIRVIGCTVHKEDEVAKAAGLVLGQPFNPQVIDSAIVALWNSGRFFPFAITPQSRSGRAREVDLVIQACEIHGVPPLAATISPELETVRRFIVTLNQWLATGDFTDFEWSLDDGKDRRIVVGVSGRDGFVFERKAEDTVGDLMISISRDAIHFDLIAGGRHGRGILTGLSEHSSISLNILPTAKNDGKLAFGMGIGYRSSNDSDGRLPIEMLVTPALPFLKPEHFFRDGGQVVYRPDPGTELLRLDLSTAMPVAGRNPCFEFRNGVVRERQNPLEKAIAAETEGKTITGWIEATFELMRLYGMTSHTSDGSDLLGQWLDFTSLLCKPRVVKPLKDLFANWRKSWQNNNAFTIPNDSGLFQANPSTMNLLVGLGAVALGEMLAPPDSWANKLTRELLFIYGGKTQYTSRTIDELLADPSIGPFGCLVTSQLLSQFDAGTARRFLVKALDQATAEGFRRDWRFWLDSPIGIGKSLEELLDAIAAIDPEDEKKAAACLAPAQAEWFHQLLARLRARPADQELAAWLAPQMDLLWNDILQKPLMEDLKARLGPSHDPVKVAAVVNGQPVPRMFVKALRENYFDRGSLQFPHPDPSRPWTMDPALAIAVRLALLEQAAARKGIKLGAPQLDEALGRAFPQLKDEPEEQWFAETGLQREEIRHLVSRSMLMRGVIPALTGPVEPATDDEVEVFYQKHARELSRKAHVHLVVGGSGKGGSFADGTRAASLVWQTSAELKQGLPFAAMRSAASSNQRAGLQLICEPGMPLLDIPPYLIMKLETLKPGGFTEPVLTGGNCVMACLEGWGEAAPRPLAEVKTKVAAWIQYQETCRRIDSLCRQHEIGAVVEVLDNPRPETSPPSAFRDLLKKDSFAAVGLLGDFWEKALARNTQAADALDSVIAEGFLGIPELVLLADSLLAIDQKPLASLCLREASDRDVSATHQAVDKAIERHKTAGAKGQQDQIGQLIQPVR